MLRGWICVTVAAAALALPAAAQAATISFAGGVLTYTAAPGETNNVSLTLGTADYSCTARGVAPCIDVLESGEASITSFPPDRCAEDGMGTVECEVPASVVVNLGDRDDALFDWEGPSTINGGAGNEVVLDGRGGADAINGGPGNDALFGGDGNDTLNGGDGNDFFEGFGGLSATDPVSTGGADVYVGGPGKDFLDYAGRTEPMSISIDGVADDGAAGEADNVGLDVEQLRGGNAADAISGSNDANWLDGGDGDDVLRGGAGDDFLFGHNGDDRVSGEDGQDTIEGGDGSDTVDGGGGIDTLHGDKVQVCIPSDCASGRDTILARDGTDETVTCGPGEDSATLDAADRIPASGRDVCEHVDRAAAGDGGASGGGGGGGGSSDSGGASGSGSGASSAVGGASSTAGSSGAGGAVAGSAPDVLVPQLQRLRAGNLRRGRSTTVRYTLSEAATVTLKVERRVKTREKVRWIKVRGTLRRQGRPGNNMTRFDGRLQGRRLKPGHYRLVAVARDAAGNQGPPRRATFRVLR